MVVKDFYGTEFDLSKRYERIVSLVPSMSELIFDLHAEERLLGVTKNCIYPSYLKFEKYIVGSPLELDFEKIQLVDPDLVIASVDENSIEDIQTLKGKYNVFCISVKNLNQAKENILQIGSLISRRSEASKINLKIDIQLDDFNRVSQGLLYRTAAYFIHNNPMVVAASDTFENSMLQLLKIKNVMADLKGNYPVIKPANIKLANPDMVILANDQYQFEDDDAIAIASNTHDASIFFVDGRMFSWYGSRIIKAIDYFKLLTIKLNDM